MSRDVQKEIGEAVAGNKVIVFMKGNPNFPQCGFSAQVAQILQKMDVEFASVNVLADADIRQGIKEYSNWPTIPQVYVGGELVGGCDITTQLYQSGELQTNVDAVFTDA